jgi:hypothetical protein
VEAIVADTRRAISRLQGVIVSVVVLSRVRRLGVLGVIKTKLRFEVASIATRTRDSKSRITEVNRGGSKAN